MAMISQTIAIVDKSNKVIGSSKQLKNVFQEAKLAYKERKAEIQAERKQKEDRELQKAIKAMSVADDQSQVSGTSHRRQSTRRRSDYDRERGYPLDRHHSSGSVRARNSPPSPGSPAGNVNLADFNQQLYGPQQTNPSQQLTRRVTDNDMAVMRQPQLGPRSYSATDVDLDLAYGEYHEPDIMRRSPSPQAASPEVQQKQEMSSLVLKCKILLDEANCAQHSVTAMIKHLQANPEAMAAVALTLAEISNIATKMAPAVLASFKTSAPAVMALLAAPEFLIAVGVGVGVTIVCLGGYKIIKKIKQKQAGEIEGSGKAGVDEMLDVHELDRINQWRRGISDVGTEVDDSATIVSGTSVEGELITPFAAESMGHLPLKKEKKREKKEHRDKKEKKRRDGESKSDSSGSERTRNGGTSAGESDRQLIKVKKPSPLRRMLMVKT